MQKKHRAHRPLSQSCLQLASAMGVLSLFGCSAGFNATTMTALSTGTSIHGSAHGGQQPLSNAHVYLYAAGKTGYGSAATSLLNINLPGVSSDLAGLGYVPTDGGGNWSISGDYSCPSANDQVYILVVGGNPGLAAGTNNTGIAMMTALGTCSTLSAGTFVIVNELSTVAAATALQQFMVDGTHLGSSATNGLGIQNAFSASTDLVPIAATSANTVTRGGNGVVPQPQLHTLANILASCVNTAASNSVTCGSLFSKAIIPGGGPATDTAMAAVNIAKYPGNNTTVLYNLSTSNPPFLPALTAAPTDFSVGITYALGGVPEPGFLAIDATGNVWSTNRASEKSPFHTPDSIVKLSPFGAVLSGTGFTAGGVNLPEGIAVDLDGSSLWVANSPGSVIKLTSAGALATNFPVSAGSFPQGIAIDTGGNAWVSNNQGNDIMQISGAGAVLKSGITATNFSSPQGVAIDYNNFIYVVGQGSSSIVKVSGTGSVISPGVGYQGAGLNAPSGIAVDNSSRLWAVNTQFSPTTGQQTQPASLSVLSATGTAVTGSAGYTTGAAGVANIVAIDGAGAAWTALCTSNCVGGSAPDSVVAFSSTGTIQSPSAGFLNAGFSAPQAVAIDASGNVWVANSAGQSNANPGSITELVGVAAPVKTPLVANLTGLNTVGTRP